MRKLPMAIVVATLALAPVAALAADVRQGQTLTVPAGQTINDDLYAFGGSVEVAGTLNGNLIVAGGNITVSGNVARDVMVAGGSVEVSGRVGGSVRATGGNLMIRGPVDGDVLAFGGMLQLDRNAKVGRDVLLATGQTTLRGDVGRDVKGSAGEVTLSSHIGRNVNLSLDTLRLEDGAVIDGNLDYQSNREAVMASGAKVQGRVQRQGRPGRGARGLSPIGWLQSLIGIFALGLIFVLVFPGLTSTTIATLRRSPWASLGIGAAILVGVPILALIALILGLLVGGWWLALIAIGLYLVALALGYVAVGLFAGRWILQQVGQSQLHVAIALLAGLVLLGLIALVPFVGGLCIFVAILFGLGALGQAVTGALRPAAAA